MRERKRRNFTGNYRSNLMLGRASMTIAGVGLLFMFGLLYLSQSNAIALKGYSLSELESKKIELEAEKDRLLVEAARLQSIQEIEKAATGDSNTSEYVPVDKINYLPSSNVAVK